MFDRNVFAQHIANRSLSLEEQNRLLKEDPPGIDRDPNKYGDYTPTPRIEPHRLTRDQIMKQDMERYFKNERERNNRRPSQPRREFDFRGSGPADPAPAVDPSGRSDGDRFGDDIADVANRLAKTGAYTQDELDRISTGQTGRPDKFTPDRGVNYPPTIPPTKPKPPSGGAGRRQPMPGY
tara:strand:+ start:1557 stop:2096 length:540 start_codon:yes stop_codon:yes gene_type:complete